MTNKHVFFSSFCCYYCPFFCKYIAHLCTDVSALFALCIGCSVACRIFHVVYTCSKFTLASVYFVTLWLVSSDPIRCTSVELVFFCLTHSDKNNFGETLHIQRFLLPLLLSSHFSLLLQLTLSHRDKDGSFLRILDHQLIFIHNCTHFHTLCVCLEWKHFEPMHDDSSISLKCTHAFYSMCSAICNNNKNDDDDGHFFGCVFRFCSCSFATCHFHRVFWRYCGCRCLTFRQFYKS